MRPSNVQEIGGGNNIMSQDSVNITDNKKSGLKLFFSRITGLRESTILLITLGIGIIMSVITDSFLTYGNIKTTLVGLATSGIVVVGITTVLAVGGIDLSVGSVMALTGIIGGQLYLLGVNIWVAALIALVFAALMGVINAFFITKIGLNPLITTLGMMSVARGLCYVITKGMPLALFSLPNSYKALGSGTIYKIPFLVLIFLVIVIIADFLFRRATSIRKVLYVGSNEESAKFSGLNVNKVKYGVYILSALTAGIAGLLSIARFASAPPNVGSGLEMEVIAAAVIGGSSLKGGEGTIFGAVLGIILLAVIDSCLVLLNVPVYWQELVSGVVLLAAVSMDYLTHSKR